MTGYADEFVRITLLDGTVLQGGTNYGLKITITKYKVRAECEDSDRYLINGRASVRNLVADRDKVKSIVVDGKDGHYPVPLFAFEQTKREEPIQTAAARAGELAKSIS